MNRAVILSFLSPVDHISQMCENLINLLMSNFSNIAKLLVKFFKRPVYLQKSHNTLSTFGIMFIATFINFSQTKALMTSCQLQQGLEWTPSGSQQNWRCLWICRHNCGCSLQFYCPICFLGCPYMCPNIVQLSHERPPGIAVSVSLDSQNTGCQGLARLCSLCWSGWRKLLRSMKKLWNKTKYSNVESMLKLFCGIFKLLPP